MIRYNLVCARGHEFESWFDGSAAYDKQAKRGLVECPLCGSAKVEKALMTPRLARSGKSTRRASLLLPSLPRPPHRRRPHPRRRRRSW